MSINVAEMVRRGLNHNGDIACVEVDPAELTEHRRKMLAQLIDINSGSTDFVLKYLTVDKDGISLTKAGGGFMIRLNQPGVDGLCEMLDVAASYIESKRNEYKQKVLDCLEKWAAAKPKLRQVDIVVESEELGRVGGVVEFESYPSLEYEFPFSDWKKELKILSPEEREKYEKIKQDRDAFNEKSFEEAKERQRAKILIEAQREKEKKEAAARKKKEQIKHILSVVQPHIKAQWKSSLITEEALKSAYAKTVLKNLGLSFTDYSNLEGFESLYTRRFSEPLSEDLMKALQEFEKSVPEGASISLYVMKEEPDGAGPYDNKESSHFLVAEASWYDHGVSICADKNLGRLDYE